VASAAVECRCVVLTFHLTRSSSEAPKVRHGVRVERESRSGRRYVGIYRAADGKLKSAGTYDSHERAYEVAADQERHARGFLDETSPADEAKVTIGQFCEQRFLRFHAVSPSTRQKYGYVVKNHIVP